MIRIATYDDIPKLQAIEKVAFRKCPLRWEQKHFYYAVKKGRGVFYVDATDEAIEGYIYVTSQCRIICIAHLAGGGVDLLQAAETYFAGRNLHCEIWISNHRGIAFYKKHGFKEVGYHSFFYGTGESAYTFRKELA